MTTVSITTNKMGNIIPEIVKQFSPPPKLLTTTNVKQILPSITTTPEEDIIIHSTKPTIRTTIKSLAKRISTEINKTPVKSTKAKTTAERQVNKSEPKITSKVVLKANNILFVFKSEKLFSLNLRLNYFNFMDNNLVQMDPKDKFYRFIFDKGHKVLYNYYYMMDSMVTNPTPVYKHR